MNEGTKIGYRIRKVKYLYHGSDSYFQEIDLTKAKNFKDFGRGFYLTTSLVQAEKWAEYKAYKKRKAFVYRYEVQISENDSLKILELLKYDKVWLDMITCCRIDGNEPKGDEGLFDIVYDRIADGQRGTLETVLRQYYSSELSAPMVISAIKFKNKNASNDQYCFKTKVAIDKLVNRRILHLFKQGSNWSSRNKWERY